MQDRQRLHGDSVTIPTTQLFVIDKSAYADTLVPMEHMAEQFKALADPTRLRIVRLLLHGELCVCDLMEALGIPQSSISRHMAVLKRGGWVRGKRCGKWIHYLLVETGDPLCTEVRAGVLAALREELARLPQAREDHARLLAYLETKQPDDCA
jgi:ArsR family transcriptional regulator